MTCREFNQAINPETLSVSYLAALVRHALQCPACREKVRERAARARVKRTPEQLKEHRAAVEAVLKKAGLGEPES